MYRYLSFNVGSEHYHEQHCHFQATAWPPLAIHLPSRRYSQVKFLTGSRNLLKFSIGVRLYWGIGAFAAVKLVGSECFASVLRVFSGTGNLVEGRFRRASGALLPEALHLSLRAHPWEPHQVVCGAIEDEDPVHLVQSAELDLADGAGLLQPSEALLNQPSPALADGVAWVSRRSAVEVAAASLVVLHHMRCDVQSARGCDEVPGVVG